MKQKIKFIATVFGVTLAMFGSIKATATDPISIVGDSSSCVGSTGQCAKVQAPDGSTQWLPGTKKKSS